MTGAPVAPSQGPSRVWYGVGTAVLVAGLVAATLLVVNAFDDGGLSFLDLQHVEAPGEGAVLLDDGGWTLYWTPDSQPFGDGDIVVPDFDVEITDATTGAPVDTDPYVGTLHISSGGGRGRAVLTFTIPTGGRYEIRSSGFPGGETGALGVGRGFRVDAGSLLVGIAIGLGSILGAALIIGFTAVRRYQARSKLRAPFAGPPTQWGPPPAAPPPLPPSPPPAPAPPSGP